MTDAGSSEEELLRSLRASEEKFRLLVERLQLGVIVQGPKAEILLCNPMALALLGLSEDQLLGRTSFDPSWNVIHEDGSDFPGATHPVVVAIRTRTPVHNVVMGVYRPLRNDRVWLLVNAEPQLDASGELLQVVCTFSDITERKRLEESLRHAQRLESIGHLAAGIAHDFNNLLTVIMTAAEWGQILAKRAHERAGEGQGVGVTDELEQIVLAAKRASSLTQQLLMFARRDVRDEDASVEVDALLEELSPFFERLLGPTIALHMDLRADAALSRVARTPLEQVLVNLLVNARDALPKGGHIHISTRAVSADAAGVERSEDTSACVELRVKDDGAGMSEAVRTRIFEPFFTTKARERGTGLGLATVYGIVTAAKGHIACTSAPGKGTEFRILLPVADAPPRAAAPAMASAQEDVGPLRVLLVDDDSIVRHQLTRVLVHGHHEVVPAASAEEALAALDAEPRGYDVVVTDVVMPGMGGRALAEAIRARNPELPIVLMSGYMEVSLEELGVGSGKSVFLPKPFSAQALLGAVASLAQVGHRARQAG